MTKPQLRRELILLVGKVAANDILLGKPGRYPVVDGGKEVLEVKRTGKTEIH